MADVRDIIQGIRAVETSEDIWEDLDRSRLDEVYDHLVGIAVDIRELDSGLNQENQKILEQMEDIITSLGSLPDTFDPQSDVEVFRQKVLRLQDKADELEDNLS
ncbi:MAG: hypothetical protein ABEJ98_00715 [Candidatus Nanohaloarchaea archaeon]